MDLVQDVIVGSVTGLALRGVRRLVFGSPQATQASQVDSMIICIISALWRQRSSVTFLLV